MSEDRKCYWGIDEKFCNCYSDLSEKLKTQVHADKDKTRHTLLCVGMPDWLAKKESA